METAHGVGEEADRATLDRSGLARTIMRRQARIGLRVALVFLVVLLGLPLLNLLEPDLMAIRVGGFSLAWLALGMLLYPVMWLLSLAFVRGSDRIEEEIVREFGTSLASPPPTPSPSPVAAFSASGEMPRGDEEGASRKRRLFVEEDAE